MRVPMDFLPVIPGVSIFRWLLERKALPEKISFNTFTYTMVFIYAMLYMNNNQLGSWALMEVIK